MPPEAEKWIERCVASSPEGGGDDDHLALACRIFAQTQNPLLKDVSARLQAVNPYKWDELFG